jgi:uncharacterized protein (TIGR01244 family)
MNKLAFAAATLLMAAPAGVFADASAGSGPAFPERLASLGFREVLARSGNVHIAGQPSEAGLARAKMLGISTVINLRTTQEMDDRNIVPYDEAAAVKALGMNYVHIPQGGPDTPYSPAALAAFAEALEAAAGQKVLLHCTVAWRASHMWAAWLATHGGLSLADAVQHGEAVNFGQLPFEQFIGRDLNLESADGSD